MILTRNTLMKKSNPKARDEVKHSHLAAHAAHLQKEVVPKIFGSVDTARVDPGLVCVGTCSCRRTR